LQKLTISNLIWAQIWAFAKKLNISNLMWAFAKKVTISNLIWAHFKSDLDLCKKTDHFKFDLGIFEKKHFKSDLGLCKKLTISDLILAQIWAFAKNKPFQV